MRLVEGRARVEDVEAFVEDVQRRAREHGSVAQAFDARLVAGRRHLREAVSHAQRARERGDSIADDAAIEVLLYAAGRRQIDEALAMGVSTGDCPVAVVVLGGDAEAAAASIAEALTRAPVVGGERDEGRLREFFGISDAELGATTAGLEDLVIERVALLSVEK